MLLSGASLLQERSRPPAVIALVMTGGTGLNRPRLTTRAMPCASATPRFPRSSAYPRDANRGVLLFCPVPDGVGGRSLSPLRSMTSSRFRLRFLWMHHGR